jgi:hypothetical protein
MKRAVLAAELRPQLVVEREIRFELYGLLELAAPRLVIAAGERQRVVDGDRDLPCSAGTEAILQPGEGRPALGQNEHHAPVERAEDASERLLVDAAGARRTARMRMNPDPRKPLDRQASIDFVIKEIGYGRVVEGDRDGATRLPDEPDVFDHQRISGAGDSEAADFDAFEVPPEQQFRPRQRREPEARAR